MPKHSPLIASLLDESIEAMRGVSYVGGLAGISDHKIILCHCVDHSSLPASGADVHRPLDDAPDWIEYHKNRFRPVMDEACQRLVNAGVDMEHITRDFVLTRGDVIRKIIEIGQTGDFGTIVVGRREVISFTQEHIRGRFGEKIISALDNMAVWVVS